MQNNTLKWLYLVVLYVDRILESVSIDLNLKGNIVNKRMKDNKRVEFPPFYYLIRL